ncbi:MAG: YraN family protein [Clostridia bacterium]|nr:YraN family protein [Clostridia bacterium]
MTAKELGAYGEKLTAEYLKKKGYLILKRNFCIRGGEIDIIAQKGEFIAFVEVKTRTPDYMVGGLEAVNRRKQRLIIKTAEQYSYKYPHDWQPRFDVALLIIDGYKLIGFDYIENAFDASGIMTIL